MTVLTFRRISSHPPPERELADVGDDGTVDVWRSFGADVAGRFTTQVALGELSDLIRAATGEAPPRPDALPPGASIETIVVGGAQARAEAGTDVTGAWGPLFARCRRLLSTDTASPVAAVGLVLADANRLRLEHRGSETLPIELGAAVAEVTVWREGREVERVRAGIAEAGRVDAGPGWSRTVEMDRLPVDQGTQVVATVSLVADDGGVYVPVVLTARS